VRAGMWDSSARPRTAPFSFRVLSSAFLASCFLGFRAFRMNAYSSLSLLMRSRLDLLNTCMGTVVTPSGYGL
jgi:hypothetical protein